MYGSPIALVSTIYHASSLSPTTQYLPYQLHCTKAGATMLRRNQLGSCMAAWSPIPWLRHEAGGAPASGVGRALPKGLRKFCAPKVHQYLPHNLFYLYGHFARRGSRTRLKGIYSETEGENGQSLGKRLDKIAPLAQNDRHGQYQRRGPVVNGLN